MPSHNVLKLTVALLIVISLIVLLGSSNVLRRTIARPVIDESIASSAQVWKLKNTRVLVDWPNGNLDGPLVITPTGGQGVAVIRGYGEVCPNQSEHIRFTWSFINKDVSVVRPGEDIEVNLKTKLISSANPCGGGIAARSWLTIIPSGGLALHYNNNWPTSGLSNVRQDERFLAKVLGRAGGDHDGNSASASITVNTKPGVDAPMASFAIRFNGPCATGYVCGVVLAIYEYELSASGSGGAGIERNTNRAGGDYTSFNLAQANYELCQQACANDSRCAAWTYVRPGLQGATARCWLKSNVPGPSTNDCCVSGVKSATGGQASLSLEVDTNRGGADYRNFDLAEARPELCRDACANDPQCRAFTYVKPGFQGPRARCWLKNSAPNGTSNACCISGVKQ